MNSRKLWFLLVVVTAVALTVLPALAQSNCHIYCENLGNCVYVCKSSSYGPAYLCYTTSCNCYIRLCLSPQVEPKELSVPSGLIKDISLVSPVLGEHLRESSSHGGLFVGSEVGVVSGGGGDEKEKQYRIVFSAGSDLGEVRIRLSGDGEPPIEVAMWPGPGDNPETTRWIANKQ